MNVAIKHLCFIKNKLDPDKTQQSPGPVVQNHGSILCASRKLLNVSMLRLPSAGQVNQVGLIKQICEIESGFLFS